LCRFAQKKFGRVDLVFLQGVFEKTGVLVWCFGGEFVVLCVVEMVLKQPLFWRLKIRQDFRIYF
jgi:hypothetical protein